VRETVALVPASAHTALGSHVAFHADAPLRNRDWLGVSAKSGAEVIMTTLVAESRIRCLETRKLLANSRALIASSRRILNRAWEVGGSSGNDLHQTVRDRLVNGALFPVPRKAWGGHGTGHVCAVCDVSTLSTEIELEVAGPRKAWAHLMGYDVWRQESAAFRESARASA
jgi:hypothetical protein